MVGWIGLLVLDLSGHLGGLAMFVRPIRTCGHLLLWACIPKVEKWNSCGVWECGQCSSFIAAGFVLE